MTRNTFNGFTLIELLVAISIFAVIAVIALSGLNYILNSSDYLSQQQRSHRQLVAALMRIEDDLAQARPRTVRRIDGISVAAFIGQPTDTRALGAPAMEFTYGGLAIIGEAPRTDLQRVAYRLNGESQLTRMTWAVLDRTATTAPIEHPLLENVEEFEARFYSGTSKPNWVGNWPITRTQPNAPTSTEFPEGVELRLKLKGQPVITRLFIVNE
jgi:general secretion pathway protein J